MNRYILLAAVLLSGLAGCGKKSGPAAVLAPEFSRGDLVGIWGGSMSNNSVEINFVPGKVFPFDSLLLVLSFGEDNYSLLYQYVYDEFLTSYSEFGHWKWDEQKPDSLIFETTVTRTLKYRFTGPLFTDNSSGDGNFVIAIWGCDFEYGEGTITNLRYRKATLKLYHTSGPLDFGEFTLTKR